MAEILPGASRPGVIPPSMRGTSEGNRKQKEFDKQALEMAKEQKKAKDKAEANAKAKYEAEVAAKPKDKEK